MKTKLIIVIVISVLLLAGGIWECVYLNKTTKELVNRLDELMLTMDVSKAQETLSWVEKEHKKLEYIISHFELSRITVDYQEAMGAMAREDNDTAYLIFSRMREYALRLNDIYRFRCQNIV